MLQQDYAVRPASKRGHMAKVHRTLKTRSTPRGGGRNTDQQNEGESILGRRDAHVPGIKQDEWYSPNDFGATNRRRTIGTRQCRREAKPMPVERSDTEEYEEGSSRLEERVRTCRCWFLSNGDIFPLDGLDVRTLTRIDRRWQESIG